MSSIFSLEGSYQATPASGTPSGDPMINAPLDEIVYCSNIHVDTINLVSGSPVTVNFGGVTNANVIVLRAYGAKIKATFTSTDGGSQSVPVDPFYSSISLSVPVTSISLTRDPGSTVATTVKLFLGERS